jgi:putative phage-type endonuclease
MTEDLQRTDEWAAARAGKFTASVMIDIAVRNKKTGAKLASFDERVWKVVTERLAGKPMDSVNSRSLTWGSEVEAFALERYELDTGLIVTPAGFVVHPKYSFVGASPDGLVGTDGCLEAKCPVNESIHLRRFLEGVPEEYRYQMQTVMWVCERDWCDFLSSDPRQSEKFQLLKIRVPRDEALIKQIEGSVLEAESAAQDLQSRLERIAA